MTVTTMVSAGTVYAFAIVTSGLENSVREEFVQTTAMAESVLKMVNVYVLPGSLVPIVAIASAQMTVTATVPVSTTHVNVINNTQE
jgi:hypothetical protein